MTESGDLEEVLSEWFASALNHLSQTQPPLRSRRSLFYDEHGHLVTRVGGGAEPRIWLWIEQQRSALVDLLATKRVVESVKSHSLESYPDHLESKISKAKLNDPEYVSTQCLFPLLSEYLYASGLRPPDNTMIAQMSDSIVDFVQRPLMLSTPSIVALTGISSPTDFVLEEGVVFRAATRLEQKRFYFGDDPTLPDSETPTGRYGTGYAPTHVIEIAERHMARSTEIAESFVLACRLLDVDTVGYRYILQRPANPVRRGGTAWLPSQTGSSSADSQTRLTVEQIDALQSRWDQYCSIGSDSAARILVDRYRRSFSRSHFEDQLVDLWVGMESVFATESSSGELQYRISLRASRLLHHEVDERLKLFHQLKKSYQCRSRIVHGGSLLGKTAEEVIHHRNALRQTAKIVLKKMVEENWRPDYPKMDLIDDI